MTKLERKRLQCVLYMLMRDVIPSGKIEGILEPLEKLPNWNNKEETFKYSAPPLEQYAKWLVDRLEEKKK